MSAVGIFGQFLMNHQVAVDAILLILLLVLVAWFVVRRVVSKPKQDAKIDELIKKIDELESKLAEREQPEAIKAAPVEDAPAAPEVSELAAPKVNEVAEAEASELAAPEVSEPAATEVSEPAEPEVSEPAELELEIDPLEGKLESTIDLRDIIFDDSIGKGVMDIPGEKYTSREWGEDRHGNVYTEEMLRDQIG